MCWRNCENPESWWWFPHFWWWIPHFWWFKPHGAPIPLSPAQHVVHIVFLRGASLQRLTAPHKAFCRRSLFFGDSVCVNMGGSFQEWNGYKKPMAYRKVLRCTTPKQWIAEVVRFIVIIIIIIIIIIINEWANGGRDASEMTWKNPCTTGRMNQWTNESTSQCINKWVN